MDYSCLVDSANSFNCPKAQAIDVHPQALPFDLFCVAFGSVGLDKLPPTGFTELALFTTVVTMLSNVCRFTTRTLHSLIMQRPKFGHGYWRNMT